MRWKPHRLLRAAAQTSASPVLRAPPLLGAEGLPLEISQARIDQILAKLEVPLQRPFQRPANVERLFALLFSSRAGSTWLGQLLGSTGQINALREETRPNRLSRAAKQLGCTHLAETLELVMSNGAVNGLYGFKADNGGLIPLIYSGAYDAYRNDLKIVILYRRDAVAQAVSIQRAKLSGRWHSHLGARARPERVVEASEYDYEAIRESVATIAKCNTQLREFARRNGHPHMELYYEDIVPDPMGTVRAILTFLDLDASHVEAVSAETRVLRDSTSKEWKERFRSDLARSPRDEAKIARLDPFGIHRI